MHKSQSLFNLIIVLHVSSITIAHLQEHKTTASAASSNHYTVLLSAAIDAVVLCFWRWVIVTPETCRAFIKLNKLCGFASSWNYIPEKTNRFML